MKQPLELVDKYKDQDWYRDVLQFHDEVRKDRHNEGILYPHIPSVKIQELRIELMAEEFSEMLQAFDQGDIDKVADGAVDTIVVILGTMISCGIDLRPIWDAVHKSNMAKKGGPIREDGKQLKPVGWKPPNITRLIDEQIEVGRQEEANIKAELTHQEYPNE